MGSTHTTITGGANEGNQGRRRVGQLRKAARAVKEPRRAWRRMEVVFLEWVAKVDNAIIHPPPKQAEAASGLTSLDEIVERARTRTDISDHLGILFVESLALHPSLIVELGVRNGESTFVFERVASIYGTKLLGVDINDCTKASRYPAWSFVKSDDIAFAGQFPDWCREHNLKPSIDILFIDTSHEFDHTVQELAHWLPFMSERSKVFFHDTNMSWVYYRKDGSMGIGWENSRGVIAALEKYFDRRFDERQDFTALAGEWLVKHFANCSGLTILEKWQGSGAVVRSQSGVRR
jgi:cephalosporin hydroxylase